MIDPVTTWAIKIAGSVVGHAIQRFTGGRPEAEWAVKKIGANVYASIHIKNPGRGGVFVQEVHVEPPIYCVAKNDSAVAIASAAFLNVGASVLLGPGEERDLPVFRRPTKVPKAEEPPSQMVRFTIHWHKTSSTWVWRPPVCVVTSTDHIKQMEDAAQPWHGVS